MKEVKRYKRTLFIFRRDLRIDDNTGLIEAAETSDSVITCFIIDPRQVGSSNKYRSTNALQFMVESLQSLEQQLKSSKGKLYLFYGSAEKVIEALIKNIRCDAVFVNKDYTPFSIQRDLALEKLCNKNSIAFHSYHDYTLQPPDKILSGTRKPYSIFTAYYKKALTFKVEKPKKVHSIRFYTQPIKSMQSSKIYTKIMPQYNKHIFEHGGRKNALSILRSIDRLAHYKTEHDIPSKKTSGLSAHIKFGTVSIREVYHAMREKLGNNPIIRQLYWHDFFTYLAFHKPHVFGHACNVTWEKLPWSYNKKLFKAWCEGKTGFPLVDAGMRQLNQTGYMHNRVRLVVASFLTKDLHIDWRWGERYFAQKLTDYDPAINNGNWQWSASTGCDAQPYFRIFNPWLQQKKFDRECIYIKTWVPELKAIAPKVIHNWFKENSTIIKGYPRPLVDHEQESIKAKMLYKKVLKKK